VEAEIIARLGNTRIQSDDLFTPGTPDDGGHHASADHDQYQGLDGIDEPKWLERLSDGLQTQDIEPHQRSLYISMPHSGKNYNIVNRNKVDPIMWEHLPRQSNELNNKEYEELQPEYKGLFIWNENGSKWSMQERYRQNWGDK